MNSQELKIRVENNPCSIDNCVIETQLSSLLQINQIEKIHVIEVSEGFYIVITFDWIRDRVWYIGTQRIKNQPRIFKDLTRMNTYIRKFFKNIPYTVHTGIPLPAEGLNKK